MGAAPGSVSMPTGASRSALRSEMRKVLGYREGIQRKAKDRAASARGSSMRNVQEKRLKGAQNT